MTDIYSIEKKLLGISTKSLTAGLTGTLLTNYLIPGGSLNVMGYNIPTYVLYFGVYSSASAVNQTVKELFYDNAPNMIKPIFAFQPVNTGIGAFGLTYLINGLTSGNWIPSVRQFAIPFTIGAGADMLGSYLTDNIVNPIMSVKETQEQNSELLEPRAPIKNYFDPSTLGGLIEDPFLLF